MLRSLLLCRSAPMTCSWLTDPTCRRRQGASSCRIQWWFGPPGGELNDDRAYTWYTRVDQLEPIDLAVISAYLDSHGPIQPDSFRQLAAVAKLHRTPLPPLTHGNTKVAASRRASP